jgi:hypothetical protein
MKFLTYIQEAKSNHDKSTSTVINKVGEALKGILPYVWFDNSPFRLGLGVLAGNKLNPWGTNPITTPGMPGVTGIAVYIDENEKIATVYEITSASHGLGTKMVEAMLNALPKDYKIAIHHDWSGGWWDKIMKKYSNQEWIVD